MSDNFKFKKYGFGFATKMLDNLWLHLKPYAKYIRFTSKTVCLHKEIEIYIHFISFTKVCVPLILFFKSQSPGKRAYAHASFPSPQWSINWRRNVLKQPFAYQDLVCWLYHSLDLPIRRTAKKRCSLTVFHQWGSLPLYMPLNSSKWLLLNVTGMICSYSMMFILKHTFTNCFAIEDQMIRLYAGRNQLRCTYEEW